MCPVHPHGKRSPERFRTNVGGRELFRKLLPWVQRDTDGKNAEGCLMSPKLRGWSQRKEVCAKCFMILTASGKLQGQGNFGENQLKIFKEVI